MNPGALVKQPGLVSESFDDGTVVLDPRRPDLHHLDIPATLVWEALDLENDTEGIVRRLSEVVTVGTRRELRSDIEATIARLIDIGLIAASVTDPTHTTAE